MDFSRRVLFGEQHEVLSLLRRRSADRADASPVSRQRGSCLADRVCRSFRFDEKNDRRFRISPYEVTEQLVNRVGEALRSAPDLALRNEDVAVVDSQKDVGLAGAVEDLTTGLALELRIEGHQQKVASFLFVQAKRRRGTSLELATKLVMIRTASS